MVENSSHVFSEKIIWIDVSWELIFSCIFNTFLMRAEVQCKLIKDWLLRLVFSSFGRIMLSIV